MNLADILPVPKIGGKQVFNDSGLTSRLGGPLNEAVRVDAAGHAGDAIKVDHQIFLCGRCVHRIAETLNAVAAAEFPFPINLTFQPVGGHFRIEQKGAPTNFRTQMRALGQRSLQPMLADIAPGANGVENHIDLQLRGLALPPPFW